LFFIEGRSLIVIYTWLVWKIVQKLNGLNVIKEIVLNVFE